MSFPAKVVRVTRVLQPALPFSSVMLWSVWLPWRILKPRRRCAMGAPGRKFRSSLWFHRSPASLQ